MYVSVLLLPANCASWVHNSLLVKKWRSVSKYIRKTTIWCELAECQFASFFSVMEFDYSAQLPSGYVYEEVDKGDGVTSIRCNISSASEWADWLAQFESWSSQKFIVKKTYSQPVR